LSGSLGFALDVTGVVLSASAALCAWRSCRWLARLEAQAALLPPEVPAPLVSLLVPARNEEANVAACLGSLLEQTHPRCEILLLDDGSTDATVPIARAVIDARAAAVVCGEGGAGGAASAAPPADGSRDRTAPPHQARVLAGRPLEDGWGGKCFACHQLAEAAQGEWLLFLDADTRLAPDAVARALAAARVARVDLASFLPRYVGDAWPNRLVVPWLYFFLTALVPLPEVTSTSHPRLSVANGQAILVRRDAYRRSGGHAAIRDHIVEDVSLAIAAKAAGLRIALLDGHRYLGCAMYEGGRAMVAGFAKSFHSAARRYWFQWAALLTLLVLIGFRPWLRVLTAPSATERLLALASIVLVGGTFAALLDRFAQRRAALAVWPLALWGLLGVAIAGGLSGLLGRELSWRGRPVGGRAPS